MIFEQAVEPFSSSFHTDALLAALISLSINPSNSTNHGIASPAKEFCSPRSSDIRQRMGEVLWNCYGKVETVPKSESGEEAPSPLGGWIKKPETAAASLYWLYFRWRQQPTVACFAEHNREGWCICHCRTESGQEAGIELLSSVEADMSLRTLKGRASDIWGAIQYAAAVRGHGGLQVWA